MQPNLHFPVCGLITITPSVVVDGAAAAARSEEIS